MIRLGITGQAGFIGTHLFNLAATKSDTFHCIPFEDAFFNDTQKLRTFVRECDVIVHLAAMNRHPNSEVIYATNIRLVKQLIEAMEAENVTPHILFASSTQEMRDNRYGDSKREGRQLLATWAHRHGAAFTGCVIPNVFGPYGRPYYNSVVATFCHQITHGESPQIQTDGLLKLIYVGDLCQEFLTIIQTHEACDERIIPHKGTCYVSELLSTFKHFKATYLEQGVIPNLPTTFDIQLFNTFSAYIDHAHHFPFPLTKHTDERGSFVETLRLEGIGGQVSFSTTKPGITRGNHYHTRKIERFAVIRGKAQIQLRRIGTNDIISFTLDGSHPAFVDMPIWTTHNITNIGDDDLYTLFWINEFYNPNDPDTFFEKV